jgi:hypothetical protein
VSGAPDPGARRARVLLIAIPAALVLGIAALFAFLLIGPGVTPGQPEPSGSPGVTPAPAAWCPTNSAAAGSFGDEVGDPCAFLSGTVSDPAGAPVAGTVVRAAIVAVYSAQGVTTVTGGSPIEVTTDEQGRFTFIGSREGDPTTGASLDDGAAPTPTTGESPAPNSVPAPVVTGYVYRISLWRNGLEVGLRLRLSGGEGQPNIAPRDGYRSALKIRYATAAATAATAEVAEYLIVPAEAVATPAPTPDPVAAPMALAAATWADGRATAAAAAAAAARQAGPFTLVVAFGGLFAALLLYRFFRGLGPEQLSLSAAPDKRRSPQTAAKRRSGR